MKKHWLVLLMLVGILVSWVSFSNAADYRVSDFGHSFGVGDRAPKELQNLPLVQTLMPESNSEVVLDEVIAVAPGKRGGGVWFSKKFASDEESGGVEIMVDFMRRTYKATKEQPNIPEEIQQMDKLDQMKYQLELKQNQNLKFSSATTTITRWWTRAASIRSEDPINLALCQTTQRMYWNSLKQGKSYRYVWGATPTSAGTNWYNGGYEISP